MNETFSSYQELLAFELDRRIRANPRYSMRAFARDIDLSPSRLSEILSKKQGLSAKKAWQIGERLGFDDLKLKWFCDLVSAQNSRSPSVRQKALERIAEYQGGVVSENLRESKDFFLTWIHLAVRRMTLLSDFKSNPSWIAQRLGVPVEKISAVIKDLLKCELLKVQKDGSYKINQNLNIVPTTLQRNEEIRKCFRALIAQAYLSISQVPKKKRFHRFHYFTIGKEQVPEFLDLIKDFENKVDHLTYQAKSHDELYSLIVSFFPLSKQVQNQNITEQSTAKESDLNCI